MRWLRVCLVLAALVTHSPALAGTFFVDTFDGHDFDPDLDDLTRARLTKSGDVLNFEIDAYYDGIDFVANLTGVLSMSGDTPFLDATNSHLFFGTATSPSVFHEFSVVPIPDPSTMTLLLGGGVCLLIHVRRLRRKQG